MPASRYFFVICGCLRDQQKALQVLLDTEIRRASVIAEHMSQESDPKKLPAFAWLSQVTWIQIERKTRRRRWVMTLHIKDELRVPDILEYLISLLGKRYGNILFQPESTRPGIPPLEWCWLDEQGQQAFPPNEYKAWGAPVVAYIKGK